MRLTVDRADRDASLHGQICTQATVNAWSMRGVLGICERIYSPPWRRFDGIDEHMLGIPTPLREPRITFPRITPLVLLIPPAFANGVKSCGWQAATKLSRASVCGDWRCGFRPTTPVEEGDIPLDPQSNE